MGNWFQTENCNIKQQSEDGQNYKNQGRFLFDIRQMVKIKHTAIRNEYHILPSAIGKGAFGEVFKASNKFTKAVRSIKKVVCKESEQLLEQYQILREFDHPNILKLYEVYIEGPTYSLVSDYYEGGSLRDKIKQYSRLNQLITSKYMQQILMALSYIHGKGFIHCDLKPQNILLDKSQRLVKIIDFGVSRRIEDNKCKQKGVGTLQYIAPEVANGLILAKSDIWSCGVILIFMLTGRIPSYNQLHSGKYQLDVDISSLLSNSVKNLIYQMIRINPSKRPTAQQALKHEWFDWYRKQRVIDTNEIQKCLCNMKAYARLNLIQSLFVSMIANFILDQQEKLKAIEVFVFCDKDCDGVISVNQLRNVIKSYCPQKYKSTNINKIFKELDKNQNREIDLREFLACTIDLKVILNDKQIEHIFLEVDNDKNGKITVQQLVDYVNHVLPENGIKQELLLRIDKNEDGFIELQQFIVSLKSLKQQEIEQ